MTAEITIERAMSDYLSVSRGAHLYGPKEFEEAEVRAWERLQAAIAAVGAVEVSSEAGARARPEPAEA